MTRRTWSALLFALCLLSIPSVNAESRPAAPDVVIALSLGIPDLIAWTPTDVGEYHVYGVTAAGVLHSLGTVVENWMVVETVYPSYAVTSIGLGGESDPTYAESVPCVEMQPSFPFVRVVECSTPGIPAKLMRT